MSVSLVGIIVVQVFWIKNAIEVKTEQFDRSVNDAMNQVVERLEKNENLMVISDQFRQFNHTINYSFPNLDSLIEYQYVVYDSLGSNANRFNSSDDKLNWLEEDFQQKFKTYSWIDSMDSHFSFKVSIPELPEKNSTMESTKPDDQGPLEFNNNNVYVFSGGSDSTEVIVKAESKVNLKRIELSNMVNQMMVEVEAFSAPISQRLDTSYLKAKLKKRLMITALKSHLNLQ